MFVRCVTRSFASAVRKIAVRPARQVCSPQQLAVDRRSIPIYSNALGFVVCPHGSEARSFSTKSNHVGDRTSVTEALWELRVKHSGKRSPVKLVPKVRSDSRVEITYDFGTDQDKVLHSAYLNPWGSMRIGKLLEDIDALAGTVANLHADDDDPETLPLSMVTASVEEVDFSHTLSMETDIKMVGFVSWVGRSSMEICVQLFQDVDGRHHFDKAVASAIFTFVALDPLTHRPCQINPLLRHTATEHEDFDQGQRRADEKRQRRQQQQAAGDTGSSSNGSGNNAGGDDYENLQLLLQQGQTKAELPYSQPDCILLGDTRQQNCFIAQPQQRNTRGRIFGGFLMRRAFELAFSTAYVFSSGQPRVRAIDDVQFQRPVEIGNLLRLNASIVATRDHGGSTEDDAESEPLMAVEVEALILDPTKAEVRVSNVFHFIFGVNHDCVAPSDGAVVASHTSSPRQTLPSIAPATIQEARKVQFFTHRLEQGNRPPASVVP